MAKIWRKPALTDEQIYQLIHRRLRSTLGKADQRECVDCGKQARDWSCAHGMDPNKYSSYEPRCRKCHQIYDRII